MNSLLLNSNALPLTWQELISAEIKKKSDKALDISSSETTFPLIDSTYGTDEVLKMIEVLISDRLTMGKEVAEFEIWAKENKSNLSNQQIKKIQKDIDYKKFLNSKIDGKFRESINILLKSKISLFSVKNLFLLLMPVNLLKKFLWFYNDSN